MVQIAMENSTQVRLFIPSPLATSIWYPNQHYKVALHQWLAPAQLANLELAPKSLKASMWAACVEHWLRMLIDSGGSISNLKRLGGWSSTTSAEGYIEDSIQNKIQTSKKIFSDLTQNEVPNRRSASHSKSPSAFATVFIKLKFQHIWQPSVYDCFKRIDF